MTSQFALYSDRFFMGAVFVYLLAMVLHACEFARERGATPAPVGSAATSDAAAPDVNERHSRSLGSNESAVRSTDGSGGRSRSQRLGRMGVALVVLGVALQVVSIVLRGLAAGRWPLGNMYEFVSAITCAALVTWLVVLRRHPAMRPLGTFVLFPALVLQFLAGTVLFVPAAPVMPALQSYWLIVHVTTVSLASGLFVVPGVASALYLLQRSGKLPAAMASTVPAAEALDRLAYRVTIVAFPLYTFAIFAGAIWAEAAWGRFWGWDPKETVAFVAWVVYAAYLHARATAGWRSGRAAWINVAGLAAIVFNLFFINMVVAGLHSYAGLN